MCIRGRCKQIFYHFLRPWHRNLVAQEIARDNLVKMDGKTIFTPPLIILSIKYQISRSDFVRRATMELFILESWTGVL